MAFTNPNNVTFLIDQLQDASLCDIHVTKKRPALSREKGTAARSVDRSTIASRTRKIPKNEETDVSNRLKRLELEMNNKFRILQDKHDKLEEKHALLERKAQGIEEQKSELKAANLELMKRIHQTAKADVSSVLELQQTLQEQLGKQQGEIDSLHRQLAEGPRQVKHTWIKPAMKPATASDKENSGRGKQHAAESESSRSPTKQAMHMHPDIDILSRRVQALETLDADVRSLHKQVHSYLNYHMSMSSKEETSHSHGPTGSLNPASASASADVLHLLKKRLREAERAIQASNKCTNDALSDQKMAILFLYRHSNISNKANMSEREVDTVFGRLGDLHVDNLWATPPP